jgi:cytochrome c biogenesis factor
MVSWIWIAVFMMGLGGLIALIPVRVRAVSEAKDSVPEDAVTA